jgi:hypothetical protein
MKIRLYAYLNIANPMVAWEVAIGRIKSSCDISKNAFGTSIWAYSLLRKLAINGMDRRFHNELKLEAIRQKMNNHLVSRLTGVYFSSQSKTRETRLTDGVSLIAPNTYHPLIFIQPD